MRMLTKTHIWHAHRYTSPVCESQGFSMLWIILAHSTMFGGFVGATNPSVPKDFLMETDNYFTFSAVYGVDTFFFISGQLTACGLTVHISTQHCPFGISATVFLLWCDKPSRCHMRDRIESLFAVIDCRYILAHRLRKMKRLPGFGVLVVNIALRWLRLTPMYVPACAAKQHVPLTLPTPKIVILPWK